MLAQVTLTPTEAKKLIGLAVARMKEVKDAVATGLVVLHPGSTNYFVVEAITGTGPKTNAWVCGIIVPKAACLEVGVMMGSHAVLQKAAKDDVATRPEAFRHSWVIEKGALSQGESLDSLLDRMGPGDVYVKGANALDPQGNVGVLVGNPAEGGTIGRVTAASRNKGIQIIWPVGLEKLIPVSIKEAVAAARGRSSDYAMGIACGLFPGAMGTVVTEVKAFEILSGVKAVPISAGGVGGAEGATTLALSGDRDQVVRAIGYAEQSKGARLPQVRVQPCESCTNTRCTYPVAGKLWA